VDAMKAKLIESSASLHRNSHDLATYLKLQLQITKLYWEIWTAILACAENQLSATILHGFTKT